MNKQQYIHTTINHIYHNILQYMHKANMWVFALFVLLLPALSFALPEQQVPLDEDNLDAKHTIWVAGDYRIVARAFRVSAAIFGDGGMVGLMKIAALFALVAMVMSVISKRNGQIMSHIILFVLMACAFNIKTPVIVASYFDGVSGGGVIGAVKHEKIDNVPIGVAWPLVIFSNIAKKLSADYDEQMQVLPDDGRLAFKPSEEGGILVHGTEGYFSPLKAILRLRHTASVGPEDELIFTNFYQNMEDCNWSKRISRYADEVGILRTLASNGQSGARVVLYYKDDNGNKKQKYTNCDAVGKYIALLMKENTLSRGNGKHSVKGEKASESGLKGVMGAFFDNRYDSKQREVDMLPNLLASGFKNSSTISRDNNTALKEIEQAKKAVIAIEWGDDRTQAPDSFPVGLANDLWKLDSVNAAMQTNLVSNRVAADEIEASIIYNHVLSECSTLNANDCNRYIMAMTSARNKAAIDSAGMASMFQHYIHYAMNILIFVYVVMSPIIMVVILAKGLAGWKLAGAYLLFAVWANSWLPLDAAIAYYMQQSYIDRMSDLITALEVSNQTHRIYSLGTLNAVLDGAQDTIASASNFMAMVPIIMLSLLSGSIYGLVQVAQRAGMTGKDYVDESKIAADLETSQVTGAARLLNEQATRSSTGFVSSEQSAMMLRASTMASTDKVSISQSEIASHQVQEMMSRAQTMAESIGTTETTAVIDSEGVATKSGWVLTHSNDTGLKAEYMEKGDSISKFTDENKNVVAVSDSSSFGKEVHAGVEGHVGTEGELGFKVFGNGATTKIGASANAGTSASHSTDHTEKTDRSSSISSANSSSFGVSDSKATFAGEGRSFNDMTGLEIGNNHISQAQISQALSQARTDTINKAASEAESYQSSHSQGYSVEFMAKDIIKDIHTSTPDNIARQEFAQAAEIAGRFSSKAYETLKDIPLSERAADDFGNGVLSLMSSNNMSEKMAGVAALYVATEDIGTAEGQRLHAQLGHLLDTYGTGDRVREIQASINAPLDAQSVDVGTFKNEINPQQAASEQAAGFGKDLRHTQETLVQGANAIETAQSQRNDDNVANMQSIQTAASDTTERPQHGVWGSETPLQGTTGLEKVGDIPAVVANTSWDMKEAPLVGGFFGANAADQAVMNQTKDGSVTGQLVQDKMDNSDIHLHLDGNASEVFQANRVLDESARSFANNAEQVAQIQHSGSLNGVDNGEKATLSEMISAKTDDDYGFVNGKFVGHTETIDTAQTVQAQTVQAEQATQINQAEVKQADIQQAEVPHSEKVADTVADNAAQNTTNEQTEKPQTAEETPSKTADDEKSLLEKVGEVAGEVAESAIKGVLGISEAHAGEMPITHRQPENQHDSGMAKTNNQGQAENNHRHSEQNENTHNQAEKDRSGSVNSEKQAEQANAEPQKTEDEKSLLEKTGEVFDNFADKVQEFGKDIAVGAGEVAGEIAMGVLGIQKAHAGTMPDLHKYANGQPENQQADKHDTANQEKTENKPFNPLDYDKNTNRWAYANDNAHKQVKEDTLNKEEAEQAKKDEENNNKKQNDNKATSVSGNGISFLKSHEGLRLKTYDDQTGQGTKKYVDGATIGYGHLIKSKAEFDKYKANGITKEEAEKLLQKDIAEHRATVDKAIKHPEKLKQHEYDALVSLSFNIGPKFKNSSVVHIINGDIEKSSYGNNLEKAWKAWNKSQGKIMKGLIDRRRDEYELFKNGYNM